MAAGPPGGGGGRKRSDSGCIPQAAFQTLIDKKDVRCTGKGRNKDDS